jgi:hypothetical protein
MNQGTQGYSLTKKTEGRKSRDTVSLSTRARIYLRFILSTIIRISVQSNQSFFLIIQLYIILKEEKFSSGAVYWEKLLSMLRMDHYFCWQSFLIIQEPGLYKT